MVADASERASAGDSTGKLVSVIARRPWWRLHRSTWVVAALVVVPQVLIIVPGLQVSTERLGGWVARRFEHGWPAVHCVRVVLETRSQAATSLPLHGGWWVDWRSRRWSDVSLARAEEIPETDEASPNWLRPGRWSYHGDFVAFFPCAIVLNLAAVSGIAGLVAGAWEWRRRRLPRPSQYRLSELFLLVLAVAGMLAFWRWEVAQFRREEAIKAKLLSMDFQSTCEYRGPVWLDRLLGKSRLHFLERVTSITGPRRPEHGVIDAAHTSDYFHNVESGGAAGTGDIAQGAKILLSSDEQTDRKCPGRRAPPSGMEQQDPPGCDATWAEQRLRHVIRDMADLHFLQEVVLYEANADVLRALADSTYLRRLILCYPHFDDEDLAALRRMPQLESLTICATYFSKPPRPLTDAALVQIQSLDNLRELDLVGLQIQGPGVPSLARMRSLAHLRLTQCTLHGESVVHLAQLRQLTLLDLLGAKLSCSDDRKLRECLPDTTIRSFWSYEADPE